VEGVEVLERGGNHEYGYLYSKDTVYDIEVEENHNYFANGILVSNCHTLKNHLTGRTEKTIELVSKFPQAKITMLSGTPIKNRVNDVFSYLKIIGHELGKSQKKFLEQYTIQSTGRGGDRVTGGKNLQDLHVKLANFMIRKTKEECLDLPDKVYLSYRYEMDDYRDEYNKIIKEMSEVKEISSLTGSLHSLNIITAKAKERGIIELAETIIESGKKVIIFSSYTEPLEDLRKHFGTSCVMVTGAVSSYNRDALVQRFINEETCTVFLANMIAGGVGINLVNASDVIFMNFPFTPSELHQAVDRAHRIGQTQSVNIHYTFCDDSIDEYIYDIVISKEIDANAVIDQGKEVIQRENTTEILIKAILKKDDVVFKKPTHKKKEELEPISGQGAGDDSGSQELHSGDRPAEPVPPTEVLRVPEGEPAAQEVVFTPPSFL
jgi:SWI/SNF-related matrix-associated actin-dependent regulator 1 of chromatin subfamily A